MHLTARISVAILLVQAPSSLVAFVEPDISNSISRNSFIDVDLSSNINYVAIDPLQALTDEDGSSSLDVSSIYVDERSGVAASIPLMTSIYPDQPSRRSVQNVNVTQLAIAAVQQWLMQNQNALSISASELFAEGTVRTAVHDDGNLIQLHLGGLVTL
jgi:hypothetical protein